MKQDIIDLWCKYIAYDKQEQKQFINEINYNFKCGNMNTEINYLIDYSKNTDNEIVINKINKLLKKYKKIVQN